jgi:primosomal protein N' (replication factor Y)
MVGSLFPSGAADIARVALPLPVDRLFDYAVPADLASQARVGCRVQVSAGGRPLVGLIAARPEAAEIAGELRPLDSVLDADPVLSPALIEVLAEEARAVLCPIGMALAAALPPGSAPRSSRGLALSARGRAALEHGAASPAAQAVLTALAKRNRTPAELLRSSGADAALLAALERDRLVEKAVVERGPRARPATLRMVRVADGVDVERVCSETLARAPRQAELLRRLARDGPCSLPSLREDDARVSGRVRELAQRELVTLADEAVALSASLVSHAPPVTLTGEQAAACGVIGEAIREARPERFLLHGITGSGKTEVYLRAVAECLEAGRQALVLVPEITLTHQILGRLRSRFGDQLAVLHSGLRPGERLGQWEQLRRGEVPIAVGARSALFAPTRDLGVIILDEEHDAAYKNEEGFRYHARSLATRRARADGCPLILGSATPSLEARHAADQGWIQRLVLQHRAGSQPLPSVEVVDLVREKAALPRGRKLILSPTLLRGLRRTLEDGAQAILLLNRRGFSTQIACFECQHVVRCDHCDVSLTYHAAARLLRCHYCDAQRPPPDDCPACGSPAAGLLGIGTERLEEEVRSQLPSARVARLDRDVAARRGATSEILRGLSEETIDVLVGTQMVAKGHDFPGVRLVGVINADLGLHFPDFRAAERTFQLLTQVAGRAGRSGEPGRVILQTYSPDHYAIRPVATHDYEGFYREELRQRSALGYPPLGHLALIRVDAPEESAAKGAAEALAATAREAATGSGCEVLGPAPAPIARLRGRHRFQVLLKHREAKVVWETARQVSEALERLPREVRGSVDVRPGDML